MSAVLSVLTGFCVVVGLFFMSVGVLGILRFPDVYTRLHADTKATTFGSLFLGLASGLCATQAWLAGEAGEPTGFWIHAAFAVVVLAVTNAVGGHAIARAAWRAGHKPVGVVDQLGEAGDEKAEKPVATGGPEAPETPEEPETPETPEEPEGPEAPEAGEGPERPAGREEPEAGPEGPEGLEGLEAGREEKREVAATAGAEAVGARMIKWAVVDPEGGAV